MAFYPIILAAFVADFFNTIDPTAVIAVGEACPIRNFLWTGTWRSGGADSFAGRLPLAADALTERRQPLCTTALSTKCDTGSITVE